MFIVLEGLDGTGKSTVSKLLATKINAEHLSTPQKSLSEARVIIDSAYEGNNHARQLFYASTVASISEVVKKLLSEGKAVVVDRYWLSTQVYHHWRANGQHLKLLELESNLQKPDLTVYLKLPLEIRRMRIEHRKDSTPEDNSTLSKDNSELLNQLYLSYEGESISGHWLSVDASGNPEEIVELIQDQMNFLHSLKAQ